MIINHELLFWNEKTYKEALKYLKSRKSYADKKIYGNIMLINTILPKVYEDFETYALCTKAGLIRQNVKQFNGWEELKELLSELGEDETIYKGIWGRIIIRIK